MPLGPPPEDNRDLAKVLSRIQRQTVSLSRLPDVIREANSKHGLQAFVTLPFNFTRGEESVVLDLSTDKEGGEDLWESAEVEARFYETLSDVLMSTCKPMTTGAIRYTFDARHLQKDSKVRQQAEERLFRNNTWYKEFGVWVEDPYPFTESSYVVEVRPLA